jgi:hypothetical protein
MARLDKNILNFTGRLGDLSFYRMNGYDRVIVRQKGGPSSERVKTDAKFQRTRENGVEFGGGSTAGKYIRQLLRAQTTGSQLTVHSDINACLRSLIPLDTTSARGERHVLISRGGQALEGLPLNTGDLFDSVVRATITCAPSREACSARVDIPQLIPGSNLRLTASLPMYRIVATLAYVPDFFYAGPKNKYQPAPGHIINSTFMAETPWYPATEGSPASTLDLQLNIPVPPPDAHYSLLVAVAIQQGEVYRDMQVRKVQKAGAAKVLRVF